MLDKLMRLVQGAPTPVEERRKLVRVPGKTVVLVTVTAGELKGAILDLSAKSFRLEYVDPLKPGQTFTVFLPETRPIQARVVWCQPIHKSKSFQIGCLFDDDQEKMANSWLKDLMQKTFAEVPIKERRKHLRIRAGTRAALANKAGDTLADGLLMDLCLTGCLLALPVEFSAGTKVRVQLTPIGAGKPLDLPGTVKHVRKGRDKHLHGLAFDVTSDPTVVKYIGILLKQYGKTVG